MEILCLSSPVKIPIGFDFGSLKKPGGTQASAHGVFLRGASRRSRHYPFLLTLQNAHPPLISILYEDPPKTWPKKFVEQNGFSTSVPRSHLLVQGYDPPIQVGQPFFRFF